MRKLISLTIAAATALAFSTATTASAQSAQERLDERYDRALAAGYKALMLCSAVGHAESGVTRRTPESVHEWELAGIQAPLNSIIQDLPYEIVRLGEGQIIDRVEVTWAEDMAPRIAEFSPTEGCNVLPIGMDVMPRGTIDPDDASYPLIGTWNDTIDASQARPVLHKALDGETYGTGSRTTAIVVRKNGEVVDWAWKDGFSPFTPQRTWSVAKSIASTIVGAAVHRGQANVADSARLGMSRADDPRDQITIDHALRMASGRYSDTSGNRTDPLYWGGTSVDERTQNWPLIFKPGTVYRYANNDTLTAVQAIEGTFEEHSPLDIVRAIGMDDTVPEADWEGNFVLSSQVWSTAYDLSKLGQLYLDDGVLSDGTRILPEGWVDYVSDPSGPQPQGTQWGYGAGWWTFRRPEGNAFEGIPDDAFAARGNRGQYVVVVPSRQVVIVRRGEDMVGTRFDIAAFTRDVLAALEE